jgi:Ca2+-binding EF-hand superfamily protein
MGSCGGKVKKDGLSNELREKARAIFQRIDVNKSGSIDKNETLKFWTSNFAKLNSEALFNAVDFDKSGQITEDEWLAFWEIVKKSGHSDKEINEEVLILRFS